MARIADSFAPRPEPAWAGADCVIQNGSREGERPGEVAPKKFPSRPFDRWEIIYAGSFPAGRIIDTPVRDP
jgi:hypothetical protein